MRACVCTCVCTRARVRYTLAPSYTYVLKMLNRHVENRIGDVEPHENRTALSPGALRYLPINNAPAYLINCILSQNLSLSFSPKQMRSTSIRAHVNGLRRLSVPYYTLLCTLNYRSLAVGRIHTQARTGVSLARMRRCSTIAVSNGRVANCNFPHATPPALPLMSRESYRAPRACHFLLASR